MWPNALQMRRNIYHSFRLATNLQHSHALCIYISCDSNSYQSIEIYIITLIAPSNAADYFAISADVVVCEFCTRIRIRIPSLPTYGQYAGWCSHRCCCCCFFFNFCHRSAFAKIDYDNCLTTNHEGIF